MERVMDELLHRLEDYPPGEFVVLGVAPGGYELRAARRDRAGTQTGPGDVIPPSASVCVEVPASPRGRVEYVMCRWTDSPDIMGYHSLQDDAPRPEWTRLSLTRSGLRLTVRWNRSDEPRAYDFAWTTDPPRPA